MGLRGMLSARRLVLPPAELLGAAARPVLVARLDLLARVASWFVIVSLAVLDPLTSYLFLSLRVALRMTLLMGIGTTTALTSLLWTPTDGLPPLILHGLTWLGCPRLTAELGLAPSSPFVALPGRLSSVSILGIRLSRLD